MVLKTTKAEIAGFFAKCIIIDAREPTTVK